MTKAMLVCALLIVSSVAARAQWMASGSDDPFAKAQQQWVFTAAGNGNVFGFRCEGDDIGEAALVFVTTENGDPTTVAAMNVTKPKLAVIIDN